MEISESCWSHWWHPIPSRLLKTHLLITTIQYSVIQQTVKDRKMKFWDINIGQPECGHCKSFLCGQRSEYLPRWYETFEGVNFALVILGDATSPGSKDTKEWLLTWSTLPITWATQEWLSKWPLGSSRVAGKASSSNTNHIFLWLVKFYLHVVCYTTVKSIRRIIMRTVAMKRMKVKWTVKMNQTSCTSEIKGHGRSKIHWVLTFKGRRCWQVLNYWNIFFILLTI